MCSLARVVFPQSDQSCAHHGVTRDAQLGACVLQCAQFCQLPAPLLQSLVSEPQTQICRVVLQIYCSTRPTDLLLSSLPRTKGRCQSRWQGKAPLLRSQGRGVSLAQALRKLKRPHTKGPLQSCSCCCCEPLLLWRKTCRLRLALLLSGSMPAQC